MIYGKMVQGAVTINTRIQLAASHVHESANIGRLPAHGSRGPDGIAHFPGPGLSQQFFQFGNDAEQVTGQPDIGDLKNGCLGVLVDRHDGACILDSGHVLYRT